MSSPIPSFDELEASTSGLLVDVFGSRDETGELSKVKIETPQRSPILAEFLMVENPTVLRVQDERCELTRVENATIHVRRADLVGVSLPFRSGTLITLPGDAREWALDEDRGDSVGPVWVVARLSREPQIQQTTQRRDTL